MSTLIIDSGNIPPAQFQDELTRAKAIFRTQSVAFFYHNAAMSGALGGIFSDAAAGATNLFVSGAMQFTTTLLAGSYARFSPSFDSTFARPFPSGSNWFCSARFRIDSTVDATTEIYVGLADPAGTSPVRLGVHGPTSTANFVLQGPAGTSIDTGVPIDNAYHTFRAFKHPNGTTYVEIDGVLTTGNVDTASDTCPVWRVLTVDVPAVPRQASLQWWCGAAVTP